MAGPVRCEERIEVPRSILLSPSSASAYGGSGKNEKQVVPNGVAEERGSSMEPSGGAASVTKPTGVAKLPYWSCVGKGVDNGKWIGAVIGLGLGIYVAIKTDDVSAGKRAILALGTGCGGYLAGALMGGHGAS
jgi:hypothetical protein